MPEHVWVTKAGDAIPVKDMKHLHLKNTIKFLERKVRKIESEIDACFAYTGGEMAEYYAGQAADQAMERLNDAHHWLCVLEHEQFRRKKLSSVNDAIAIMQEAVS